METTTHWGEYWQHHLASHGTAKSCSTTNAPSQAEPTGRSGRDRLWRLRTAVGHRESNTPSLTNNVLCRRPTPAPWHSCSCSREPGTTDTRQEQTRRHGVRRRSYRPACSPTSVARNTRFRSPLDPDALNTARHESTILSYAHDSRPNGSGFREAEAVMSTSRGCACHDPTEVAGPVCFVIRKEDSSGRQTSLYNRQPVRRRSPLTRKDSSCLRASRTPHVTSRTQSHA